MRWVTLYPLVENVHLTKDLGLIPWTMAKHFGYKAKVVSFRNNHHYPALKGEVQGLELEFMERAGRQFFLEKGVFDYLKKEAQNIDVLHLFHLSRDTLFYGNFFKKLNPNGLLYIKTDAYNQHLTGPKSYSKNFLKNFFIKREEKSFLKSVDLFSIENTNGLKLLIKAYPSITGKTMYLPNGCNDSYLDQYFKDHNYSQKKDLILSVGRPGDWAKNYELLLEALPLIDLHNWEMLIAGPISNEFAQKWEQFQTDHPEKAAKVTFLGEVKDRLELYKLYRQAKVFFLPSRFESFGIAYAEALYFGCYLIGNREMAAYSDLSANGKTGAEYKSENPQSLADAIHLSISLNANNPSLYEAIRKFASENFYWSAICARLNDKLMRND